MSIDFRKTGDGERDDADSIKSLNDMGTSV